MTIDDAISYLAREKALCVNQWDDDQANTYEALFMGMQSLAQIKRVKELVKELNLEEVATKDEFYTDIDKNSINEIRDIMWKFYCFACDVSDTLFLYKKDSEIPHKVRI